MAEGLSASEVGKEIGVHAKRAAHERRDLISLGAVLLCVSLVQLAGLPRPPA
jgi:hypothetical protein